MNKVALVTGATSGFGNAIARALAKDGYSLIITGRRVERLEALSNELGVPTHALALDVRVKDSVFKAIESLPSEFKNIEILVNNAGLALGQERVQDADLADFETMIDTNVKGLVYMTKAALPALIANRGYIFNLGSVAGTWPYPGGNVYGATKAFVRQFSLNIRNDLRGTGVRVTDIAPGIAKTEFSLVRFKGDEAKSDAVYDGTDYLTAGDIAQIVLNCVHLPSHVNINSLEVMATTQTWAGFAFER